MTHVEQRRARPEKETIHSGHFMVSQFEAEAQDDDDLAAVTVPDEEPVGVSQVHAGTSHASLPQCSALVHVNPDLSQTSISSPQQISIETSLTKLFKCMTLAYRQKLTSPKWNRFKGIKLRWKDKIRLNNVIWRCWHMQFIKRKNTLVCQFASPLDVDLHVKPETTILEGKYWKRRAEAVTAEYKKWRMFHMRRLLGRADSSSRDMISDMDVETFSLYGEMGGNMLTDEDYIAFMSDTLFSTISSNQPFAFPDTREIARGASLADFIQPSLGPLQPNLDDYMDTLEPLHDLLSESRLPPVPEEAPLPPSESAYRTSSPMDLYATATNAYAMPAPAPHIPPGGGRMLAATVKRERAQPFDAGTLFATELHLRPHPHPQPQPPPPPAYPPHSPHPPHAYDARTTQAETLMQPVYGGKSLRATTTYTASGNILPHPDAGYHKPYSNQVLTPSQTAPETVSLLQQSMQTQNMAASNVLAGRAAYARERASRPRIVQYTSQLPHQGAASHFQPYAATAQHHAAQQSVSPQYMPAASGGGTRSYKMSAPAAPSAGGMSSQPQQQQQQQQQQVATGSSRPGGMPVQKENFRSNSLPLGVQLNSDWTVSAAPPPPPPPPPHHTSAADAATRTQRGGGVLRRRSRSSSSGGAAAAGAAGAPGGGRRVPPPLASVSSEPSLPQASIMLAQLLSSQHSQSMYKLNVSGEESAGRLDFSSSPLVKQASPADNTVMSPLHSGSPGTSPPQSPSSPRPPRRATHLHAEQKRRCNIKNGFDTLQALIPHLNNNPSAKVSKAAMLHKGAEYIKQLKAERNQIKQEMESLQKQSEHLNNSINTCHSLLPATGAPVSRARAGRLREMFARHVAARTLHNWKYWLFSMVTTALVESFSNCVSCGSGGDLVRSTLLWAEQHCSLAEMRPAVMSSLRVLCTTTDILTSPERLPEEARAAAARAAAIKPEPL